MRDGRRRGHNFGYRRVFDPPGFGSGRRGGGVAQARTGVEGHPEGAAGHQNLDRTYWPSIVRKVYKTIGQFIVNDVTAGTGMPAGTDPTQFREGEVNAGVPGEMLRTVGELGLPFVAMHMRGNPFTMQSLTEYNDVTEDLLGYFEKFSVLAEAAGISDWILDPGFGFAKTIDQNYQLMRDLSKFKSLGKRILVGISRKSMIFRKFGITPEEALPATQVLHYKSLCEGADILRVHDVAEAVRTVELYRTLE